MLLLIATVNTDTKAERKVGGSSDRQDGQTDTQTDRQADRQTDRPGGQAEKAGRRKNRTEIYMYF